MSFTKNTLEQIQISINAIQKKTVDDNDLTVILDSLNAILEISERFNKNDNELEFYWNEIITDSISIIDSAISGHYRLAIAGLRNMLELACHAFYFYDHKIELRIFINENTKLGNYVSTLVRDQDFFTTVYIKTFFKDIELKQTKIDSVSSYLCLTYSKLCDVVHGRYASLTKINKLEITYSKDMFKKFESTYLYTLSAISTMYVLRFNDFTDDEINKLVKISNSIKN
ncbi:MAG: hypothetical protein O9353_00425 [Bacteroidia bacterium]|nr:hypothetical protein [Bacteroidia bacterium]